LGGFLADELVMSSQILQRSERHRLVEFLLRVRAAVYLIVSVPLLVAPSIPITAKAAGIPLVAIAVGAPFFFRRSDRYSGVRLSALIDVVASYVIWLLVPWAGGLSLLLTLWALAVVVFLSPPASAARFTLFVIVLEASKIGVVLMGGVASDSGTSLEVTDIGIVFARTIALSGAYLLFRAIDAYILRLAAAAESGGERYRRLMDAAPTGYLIQDDSQIVYANVAAGDLLECPSSGLNGRSITDIVVSGDRSRLNRAMRVAWDRLEPVNVESLRLDIESSQERWVDATCTVIDHGRDLALQIALHDRSGQRRAELDLHRSEVDYREFFERIPVALYRSLPNGTITQANAALVELLGAESESEVTALDARDLYLDEADRDQLTEMLEQGDVVVGFEVQLKRLDGQTIWVRVTSRRIETPNGITYEGSLVDVTGRRGIEDELWARAAQQEAAATVGQIALNSNDITATLAEITRLVSRVLGTEGVVLFQRYPDGDYGLSGAAGNLALAPDMVSGLADRAHMTTAAVVLRSEAEVRLAAPGLAETGVESCAAVVVPCADTDFGTLVALSREERLFTADDINFMVSVTNVLAAAIDRSVANARLEDLLRSKDAFVASVSHELRTPLTVVTGMAHELNERWMNLTDEELGEFTMMLVEQSRDMSDLIEDLLVAARSTIGNVAVRNERVSLKHEIETVLAGFPDTGSSTIAVRTKGGKVSADPIRVRQILRNLITNAMRYGGRNIEIRSFREPGSLAVEVVDDGQGIAAADHERIFVAYERAHHVEGQPGSVGLGLTVSRTLAELMGGSLTYRYDGRSVFRLELPRSIDDSSEDQANRQSAADEIALTMRTVGSGRIGVDVGVTSGPV
jgi:PAS domain S-box-containing protein